MLKISLGWVLIFFGCESMAQQPAGAVSFPVRLITLDPGHFHAALVQKSGYADIDTVVHVYSPGGQELQAHLSLIEKYNTRSGATTKWKEIVYTGPDYLAQMISEKAGNVVVVAGNNRKKIGYVREAVDAGFNVFSDKPMIIEPRDLPLLEGAFAAAKKNHVILYDIMTERYQITTILQRFLAGQPAIFGRLERGTEKEPAVTKESVHHFFKYVSGKPLTRPAWYFDVAEEGEGIVDVTTHLVDLIQWECFPDSVLDYKKDITMLSARRWPTAITPAEFEKAAKLSGYPAFLAPYVKDRMLNVYANGEMNYTLRGVHARVSVRWNFEAPEGTGDTHYSVLRGTLANLVIRQGKEQSYKPVLSIEPLKISAAYETALRQAIAGLQGAYPGLALTKTPKGWDLLIPDEYALDHESTFAEVTKKYLGFVKAGKLPDWEVPDMLAKYYTTTKALEMARAGKK